MPVHARRLAAACLAAAFVSAGLGLSPALANPSDGTPVRPGEFCAKKDLGKTWYSDEKFEAKHDMVCRPVPDKDGGAIRNRWVKIGGPDDPGDPSPDPTDPPDKPKFEFGPDKVKLSTNVVKPGGTVKITVMCPTTVTIKGNGFTQNPLEVTKVDEVTHTATGVYKKRLPKVVYFVVICTDFGGVKFTTEPDDKGGGSMEPREPRIPRGRIDTGDGSYGTFALNGR